MGVDICMYVKIAYGDEPNIHMDLPEHCDVVPILGRPPVGDATHEVRIPWRYYSPECERGPWPSTAFILMLMHNAANVETVWYYGDCSDGDEPFTPERVNEYSLHYMKEK